jgi:uncharacterized membrane protein
MIASDFLECQNLQKFFGGTRRWVVDLGSRVAQLEGRLNALETWLKAAADGTPMPTAGAAPLAESSPRPAAAPATSPWTEEIAAPARPPSRPAEAPRPVNLGANVNIRRTAPWVHAQAAASEVDDTPTASRVLGLGGGLSLVLACVYLIRIAINQGVFTPERQVGAAAFAGLFLIFGGLVLKSKERHYGSYPAGTGVAVLFLAIVGGHQYYHLIGDGPALAAIAVTCALGVWLDMVFASGVFPLLTALGAYMAPALVGHLADDLQRLVFYFAACGAAFCAWAVATQRRQVYLTALYLGLAAFAWHARDGAWRQVIAFQVLQLVLFAATAAMLSLRRRRAMSDAEAAAHAPALAIFYLVVYATLRANAPAMVPWAALASAGIVAGLHQVAKSSLRRTSGTMQAIVVGYVAVALIHAVYIESVPPEWAPWVGLLSGPAILFVLRSMRRDTRAFSVLLAIVCILFLVNNARVLVSDLEGTPARDLLRLCYAAQLWAGFYFLRGDGSMAPIRVLSLYAGHLHALVAAVMLLENRLQVSLVWGGLAVVCLLVALSVRSREIGRSALLILACAGAKGAFYDLDGSKPVLRVACLAVLGISLFAGGWLYQKLARLETA